MPNRLLTALLLPAVCVAAPSIHAAERGRTEVIALCASPAGLGRYFHGDIMRAEAPRPASAATERELSLVRQDGYLDHFVFQVAGGDTAPGKVVWATQRLTRGESGTRVSAPRRELNIS